MPADLVLELPATTSGLHECLARIEEICRARNLPRDTIARLRIVAEELFSNTIGHGYGGESDRPVHVRLRCSPPVALVYEDAGPPFDPTGWQEPSPVAGPSRGELGRKGIALVLGLAASARYERLPGGNRMTIEFA